MASRKKIMDPRSSFGVYPRFDSDYRKKRSLNFDMMKSEIFINRRETNDVKAAKWVAYFLIGLFTGCIAFGMSKLEEWLLESRDNVAKNILRNSDNNQWLAWLGLAAFCFGMCCLASFLTVTVGPGANGSGIAEIMAYLNGVNYPNFIGVRTLVIKILCVVLGISGALFIGKEGPLAHIGAVIAVMVIYYVPIKQFDYFKNDVSKREFMCAGVSAGVSAAFGAPIGGALFSYELSKPTTFWTFSMIWRTFFCCSVSTFTLSFLNQILNDGWENLEVNSAGTLKFGTLQDISVPLSHIWGAIMLGILGGVFGSLFISVNTYMSFYRKKYITSTWRKVLECGLFGVATISVMTLLTSKLAGCIKNPLYDEEDMFKPETAEEITNFNPWVCKSDEYNPLATLFFNTEAGTIRSLFHDSEYYKIDLSDLIVFGTTWYIFTIITYGVWVPAGLFLPGIIMGGAMGRIYTMII